MVFVLIVVLWCWRIEVKRDSDLNVLHSHENSSQTYLVEYFPNMKGMACCKRSLFQLFNFPMMPNPELTKFCWSMIYKWEWHTTSYLPYLIMWTENWLNTSLRVTITRSESHMSIVSDLHGGQWKCWACNGQNWASRGSYNATQFSSLDGGNMGTMKPMQTLLDEGGKVAGSKARPYASKA